MRDDINLDENAIDAYEFLCTLRKKDPFATVFLLDCCRQLVFNSKLQKATLNQNSPISDDFKPMHMDGSLIAFACAPGTLAIDGKGQKNSPFTKSLLNHIKTPNEDIQMILRDVRREVKEESKSNQIPFISDGLLKKDICLYGQSCCKK